MAHFSAFVQIDKLSRLHFEINVLNNETVILPNPADIRCFSQLGLRPRRLSRSGGTSRDFSE